MAYCLDNQTGEKNGHYVLFESKTFQQARERTLLPWSSESLPCRMQMKKAGWFVVRNTNDELVAVCLYCEIACKGWTRQHDPYKVHKNLSPNCVFILYAQNIQTPSSPIIDFIPHREEVRPSSHKMAELFKRTESFEQWPSGSPLPSPDDLAEAGLFCTGQNTIVECFSCHGQISIFRPNDNPMLAHTNRCKYAKHLRNYPLRTPLDIQASDKIYELFRDKSEDNIIFYFLKCINNSTPGILLSTLIYPSNDQGSKSSDMILKRLRPSKKLNQKVNWGTSSDGPLVNILKDLACKPEHLSTLTDDQQYLKEESSILSPNTKNNLGYQCKTCLTGDASPHIVSIKCCHLGLCSKECFSKWMTCVICGYTLGKTIRIYHV